MPVSGHQGKELRSSDFMGVPIKKRKFWYNCSSSPPRTVPDPVPQPEKDSNVKPDLHPSTSGNPVKVPVPQPEKDSDVKSDLRPSTSGNQVEVPTSSLTTSPPHEEKEGISPHSSVERVKSGVVPPVDSTDNVAFEKHVGNTEMQNNLPSQKLSIFQKQPAAEKAQSSGNKICTKIEAIDEMQLELNKAHWQREPILQEPVAKAALDPGFKLSKRERVLQEPVAKAATDSKSELCRREPILQEPIPKAATDSESELCRREPILQEPVGKAATNSESLLCKREQVLQEPVGKAAADSESELCRREPVLQEPVAKAVTDSGSILSSKCTLLVSNDTAFRTVSEMQGVPGKAHLQVVEGTASEKGNNPKLSEISVNEEPMLESGGLPFPDLAVKDDERVSEDVKSDPCLLNLVSTQGQNMVSPSSHNSEAKTSCTRLETNRTHWDLNTTMDTWESSMNHSARHHELGTNEKQNTHFKKTVLSESNASVGSSSKVTLKQREVNFKLPTMTAPVDPQTKNDIQLHLSLSSSSVLQTGLIPAPSCTSSKIDAKSDLPSHQNLSRNMLSLSGNLNLPDSKIVKSEPSDENKKHNFRGVQACDLKLVNDRTVKTEPSVECLPEHSDISSMGNLKLITPLPVKSESACGVNQECSTTVEENSETEIRTSNAVFCFEKSDIGTSNSEFPLSMQVVHVPGVSNCTMTLPSTMYPPPCSTLLGLSSSSEAPNQSNIPANVMACSPSTGKDTQAFSGAFASDSISESACSIGKNSEVAGDMSSIFLGVGYNLVGSELPRIKSPDKLQLDGNSDIAGSDEEKINLSVDMDECSSNSDEDSDNNHGASVVMGHEDKPHGCDDDDYEDGEVREPIVHAALEVGVRTDQVTECDQGISDKREVGLSVDVNASRPGITKSCNGSGAHSDLQLSDEHDNCINVTARLQETSSGGQVVGTGKGEPTDTFPRGLLNCIGKEDDINGCENFLSVGTVCTSQGIAAGDDQCTTLSQQENVIIPEETKFSIWSKTESPVVGAEATKDVNTKGNQSRIINLAQAFSGPSQGRKIAFPGKIFPSRVARERNDGVRNGEKSHLRGSRDDASIDGRIRFERQRNHDLPVGNAGSDFMHERGRPDKRFDSPHAAVVVSAGRKPLNDELSNFRHPASRRRSPPGGRGRPVQIVRRSDRDISPDRCIGRGDPNLMRLRPDKKFMRGLPADMMDTVFSRSQPQFQQVDDHFVRRERSFSPIQRKGPIHMPRGRSRSPSRTRSPGPWSSPRRKSPDGFVRSEMIQRRSPPPYYRLKRLRSPHQRSIFPDEVEGRRHGSPPYRISSDLREMGPSREADHPRPFIPNRSPSGRVLPRGTTRRYDMMERERIDTDDYFDGPMHSDRFHEIGSNGGGDGRRICTERRRSFRPTYDAGEVEKFHFHVEGGRPFRFSPDSDAEYLERGNLRDREFERRVKSRTGNTPRRTRSVEEHEENYRHGEQGWHGAGFDDSPGKRRRF